MEKQKKVGVLVAKPGLDGHDRGAKLLAHSLRNAGMEVIYTGLRQTPAQIAQVALQEDVDVVALSCLSGAHVHLFPKTVECMKEAGIEDIPVIGGGIIPNADIAPLKEAGIKEVFTPGSLMKDIISYIKQIVS